MRRLLLSATLLVGACQEPVARRQPIVERWLAEQAAAKLAPALDVAALAQVDPWAPKDGPSFGMAEPPSPAPAEPAPRTAETIVGTSGHGEPVVEPTSQPVVNAMHSTAIESLAVTDDGTVAVSTDLRHSVRLWPTLDGTREPVVIGMRPPLGVAVARLGDELVIAGLDEAGQLELVRTTRAGEVLRRVFVETGRPLASIQAAGLGFVGLRDDRAIVGIPVDGAALATVTTLVADPGEHVTSLAVRHGRVLAMLENGSEVRGRWVEPADGLHWGARTAALPIGPGPVALSPDGTRVAGVARNTKSAAIIDLARGRVIARPYKETFPDPKLRPAGFLTNGVAVFASGVDNVFWWGRVAPDDTFALSRGPIAVGDNLAVGASSEVLVLAGARASDTIEFLGYRMGTTQSVLPIGGNLLATDGRAVVEIDAALHTRAVHEMPSEDASRSWYTVTLVDRTHVVAGSYSRAGSGLYLVDLATDKATLIDDKAGLLGYEPSTRMLALQTQKEILIRIYDPKTATFGAAIGLPVELRDNPRLKLFDPARAGGNVLAIATNASSVLDSVHVTLVKRVDPTRDPPVSLGRQRDLQVEEGFWDVNGDSLSLIDRVIAPTLPLASPDGSRTVELHDARITLRDKAGTETWTVPSAGATDLTWMPDGSLIAHGAGMARLDLASGAFVQRQCGWRFGRWDIHPGGFGVTSVCEAPAHF
jgi:hypothetical protein